jgi:hypothetical protein
MGNLLKLIDTSTHGKGVRITHIHRTGLTRLPYRLPSDCYTDLDQIGVPAWIRFHVWMAEYRKGEAYVVLGFSPAIAPYLTLLHTEFTRYKLKHVGNIID